MIIDFLEAFGRDFSRFFLNGYNDFFSSTMLLVVGIVLLSIICRFIFLKRR